MKLATFHPVRLVSQGVLDFQTTFIKTVKEVAQRALAQSAKKRSLFITRESKKHFK